MVHGGARARLAPAHAQRIIGITGAGDHGLIALGAFQTSDREQVARILDGRCVDGADVI